jgi:hypothetical protein
VFAAANNSKVAAGVDRGRAGHIACGVCDGGV